MPPHSRSSSKRFVPLFEDGKAIFPLQNGGKSSVMGSASTLQTPFLVLPAEEHPPGQAGRSRDL